MHPLGQHQGLLHIVGDQQHREAGALPELQQEILHGLANLQIQGAKGLIESNTLGLVAKVRAMATRCCIPPESSRGSFLAASCRPTTSRK